MAKYDENGNLIEDEEQKEGQEETQTPTPPTNVPKPSWREEPRNSWESYTSAWNRTNPLESDEDYEKRRRRTRASAIISSLGEGLSSMANLYYTTHYSPSAAPTNLSAGMLKRYNDMEADRAKNKEAWAKGYQQAKQLDEQKNEKDRNWNLTLQQYLDNKGYKDADEKRKDENQRMSREKHDWEGQLQPSKRRQAEAQAGMAEQQLKNLPQEQADRHAQSVAATAAANRSNRGGGSSSSGSGSSSSGGGGGRGKIYGTFLGYPYYSQADYESMVNQALYTLGLSSEYTTSKTNQFGDLSKENRLKTIASKAATVRNHLYNHPEDEDKVKHLIGPLWNPGRRERTVVPGYDDEGEESGENNKIKVTY